MENVKVYALSNYIIEQILFDELTQQNRVLIFSTISCEMRTLNYKLWNELKANNFSVLDIVNLADLIQAKFVILQDDEPQFKQIIEENQQANINEDEYYYVIQPSALCQLGCHYCGQSHSKNKLSQNHQNLVIERIINELASNKYTGLSIGWFGGEPTTSINIIQYISQALISYCRDHDLNYSAKLVSNGISLDLDKLQLLSQECQISLFEITLDGIAEFHNQRRQYKNNKPSFNKIYQTILAFKQLPNNINLSIRCNVDERNKDGITPLIMQLHQDGILTRASIYFAQIHAWGNDAHTLAADKQQFADWEIEWLLLLDELGYKILPLPRRNKHLCMATSQNSELIDPFGNIFSCTEVSLVNSYLDHNGNNIYQIGHITHQQRDQTKRNQLADFIHQQKLKDYWCGSCKLLPICGGSCPKAWLENIPPCPSIKYNINQRLLIHYAKTRLTANT
ncbi:MAG: hypothetical protein RLZZ293_620 [Pseudomonadota bacterium]